ncbi:hypothetical protein Q8F55_005493 [Vanrija albida]|uniref:Uncharacterized protein n=1 Tax=Vanrija albida TaxID=181172 RepID=A0ABR3Q214_9TREE
MIPVPPVLAPYLHAPCFPLLVAGLHGGGVRPTPALVAEASDLADFVASGGSARHVSAAERLRCAVLLEQARESLDSAPAAAQLAAQLAHLTAELRAVVAELASVRANLAAMEAEFARLQAARAPARAVSAGRNVVADLEASVGVPSDEEPDLITFSPVLSAAELPDDSGYRVDGDSSTLPQPLVITKGGPDLAIATHYNPSLASLAPPPAPRSRADTVDTLVRAIVLLVYAVGVAVLSSNKDV